MMAGEIEYENFIYENGDALFGFTGHAMILIFVVLVSIILMNLLVGLAVSDIQVIFELIVSWLNHKSGSFLWRQLMIANYRVKKFVRKSQ